MLQSTTVHTVKMDISKTELELPSPPSKRLKVDNNPEEVDLVPIKNGKITLNPAATTYDEKAIDNDYFE